MVFKVPELGYDFNALEPFIDAMTMQIHHDKHHTAYVNKLNEALTNNPELQNKPVEELIKNLNSVPEGIRNAVRNHGGGHLNHSMFWLMLKKDVRAEGKTVDAIRKDFGSFEQFKDAFKKAALGQFGSGWAWLVVNPQTKKLEIVPTANQDNPITQGKIPILGVDVWEHAYYLKYQNKRDEYVENFFNVINWKQIDKNFSKAH